VVGVLCGEQAKVGRGREQAKVEQAKVGKGREQAEQAKVDMEVEVVSGDRVGGLDICVGRLDIDIIRSRNGEQMVGANVEVGNQCHNGDEVESYLEVVG
jgi:hypothetical protein